MLDSVDILIEGATLLTMDATRRILTDVDDGACLVNPAEVAGLHSLDVAPRIPHISPSCSQRNLQAAFAERV